MKAFVFVTMAVAILLLAGWTGVLREEKARLAENQETLLSDVRHYKTSDSLNAAGVSRLTLTNDEFRKHCVDLERTVENLNLKVKRLQSVSRTATETRYVVKTVVRDSVVAGRGDTLKCVDHRDEYLTLNGCISGGLFSGVVESRDTIDQVVHRVPRKFLFFKFGCKAIRQEVVSRNPNSRIAYTEYIELK